MVSLIMSVGAFLRLKMFRKREASPYKDWFHIDFNGDSPYQDNFYYEGWEGHYELVKLNLDHPGCSTLFIGFG